MPTSLMEYPILIGDVGGTNVRFSIIHQPNQASLPVILKVEDFHTLDEAIVEYLAISGTINLKSIFLAIAGPVTKGSMKLTNSNWILTPEKLAKTFNVANVHIINDFEAQALAAATLPEKYLHHIGPMTPCPQGNRVVMGAGTGLGVAGLLNINNQYIPIAGEGGHIDYAPQNPTDLAILPYLKSLSDRISAEDLLSGNGLVNIYRAICLSRNLNPVFNTPEDLTNSLGAHCDAEIHDTIHFFLDYLARFAGDMALIYNASGGVYIGGGIVPKLMPYIDTKKFRAHFENKAPHCQLMQNIATVIMLHPNSALFGMENYIYNQGNFLIRSP